MLLSAPSQTPPIVLTFGISDPTSSGGIQLDLLTHASIGCHTVSVITGISTQDSAIIEDSFPINRQRIDEQARCLLEDMPIQAIKIGGLYSLDAVSCIAEILADYPDIPAILHLGADELPVIDEETEQQQAHILDACLMLLSPHCQLVIVGQHYLERHITQQRRAKSSPSGTPHESDLLERGCEYVLTTSHQTSTEDITNQLCHTEHPPRLFSHPRLAFNFKGASHTLASACTALIAHNMPIEQACEEAHEYTKACLAHGFRPGMGRVFLDHFFWAKHQPHLTS